MTLPSTIRANFICQISMLADISSQLRYERDVPWVPTHRELVYTFYPDYVPTDPVFIEAFSEEELSVLAEVEAQLRIAAKEYEAADVHSVDSLQRLTSWQHVIERAKKADAVFKKPNQSPQPTTGLAPGRG